jgi:hypothetical protein
MRASCHPGSNLDSRQSTALWTFTLTSRSPLQPSRFCSSHIYEVGRRHGVPPLCCDGSHEPCTTFPVSSILPCALSLLLMPSVLIWVGAPPSFPGRASFHSGPNSKPAAWLLAPITGPPWVSGDCIPQGPAYCSGREPHCLGEALSENMASGITLERGEERRGWRRRSSGASAHGPCVA